MRERSSIEQRWLKSLRQINGVYEHAELSRPEGSYGSRVYIPLTRRLRNMVDARLSDLLFPSDNRSFVCNPSPIADIIQAKNEISSANQDLSTNAIVPGSTVADFASALNELQSEAEVRASRMQRQIDDRLAESKWPAKARRAISDAIDLGTGIVKGPVAAMRRKRSYWPDPSTSQLTLSITDELVPTVEYVDVWNFYPDMSATHIDDCADVAEVHVMTKTELKALRDQPGFNSAAIEMIVQAGPSANTRVGKQQVRDNVNASVSEVQRFCVWEYHGMISGADINACCDVQEHDDTEEYSSVVWFCNGTVIKAIVQPLDKIHKHIYSVIWWQRDKSSIFGIGLADETRDQASSANGSFRAMLDNQGLTLGPQIVYDDTVIQPVDGNLEYSPNKLWRKTDPSTDVRTAFSFFQTESRINELMLVFNRSKELMDEVATAPAFAAGSEQPNYTNTILGTSLAYNASTLWTRRFVRHWDDDMIEPLIGRMIDWEMDFNPDESIKGDHQLIAKGIGGLIELEGQGQRMTQFITIAQQLGVPPKDKLRLLRMFAKSLKIDPDSCLPTEEELKAMPAEGPSPAQLKMEQQSNNAKMVHDAKLQALAVKKAELEGNADMYARREKLALMELASKENTTIQQAASKYGYDLHRLDTEMADNQAARDHAAQMQNAEMALKLRMGSGI